MDEEVEKAPGNKYLSWVLRILLVLLALFLGMFSLDVFNSGYGFWKTTLAFVIHNIPSLLLLGVLTVAWHWEHIAGILLVFFAILGTFSFGPISEKTLVP